MSEQKTPTPSFRGRSLLSAGGLVLVLVILVLVNVIFAEVNLRWDATEDNLYSLNEGSKEILRSLDQEVTLKFFYSRDMTGMPVHIKTYARRMRDFLKEYERYSDGKVELEVYNPEPDSEAEEWAQKYGLEGAPLPTGETAYFGLVALAADQEEVIPMLDPTREQQLEYDITRIISRVQSPEKPQIAVISGLPVFGSPSLNMGRPQQGAEPWLFVQELRKTYDVEEIPATDTEIPPETDLLLLVHPKDMSEGLQYAVDQYVLRGGSLIAFLDPLAITDASAGSSPRPSSLNRLMGVWGLEMNPGNLLVDFGYPTRLQGQNNQMEENPLWISPQPEAFNDEAIITAQLETMLFPMAGTIRKAEGSQYEYEPLVQSSPNATTIESSRARFGTEMIRRNFQASGEPYDLAVKTRGTFKTAFPDGKPEAGETAGGEAPEPSAEEAAEHLTEGQNPATLVIIGDADLLFDNFYVSQQNFLGFNIARMFNDNLNFLLNGSETLTGSEALIGIRSRGKFERPFTRVQELEEKAQARWLEREQELVQQAEETNRKLNQLQQQKEVSQELVLSPEQEAEIERFQAEKRRIDRELKEVRRNLRAEIESLGNTIKFINIFLMVFIVALAGTLYGLYRRSRSIRGNRN